MAAVCDDCENFFNLNSYWDGDSVPFPRFPLRICLSGLRPSTGGKSARKAFLLTDGKLTSAKMLLAPAKPVLRITIRGKDPPDHPLILGIRAPNIWGN